MNNSQDNLHHFDIAIVGAGMVGSALACGLADAGYRVVIYEQKPPPSFSPSSAPAIRISALSHASEQLLDQLGAMARMHAMRTCPYRRLAVWEAPWRPGKGTTFDCRDVGLARLGSMVENDVTQIALHQAMHERSRITLRCPADIVSHEVTPEAVSLTLPDATRDTARLVIGADGAASRVREWACIGLSSDQYEQQAMVITVEYQGEQQDMTWQEFHPSGPTAFLPLADVNGRHYASLVWYHHADEIARLRRLPDNELMQAIQTHFPEALPPLIRVVEHAHFPLFRRHAQRYFQGRFVLAGDAAHTINPLAGQGVNLGFQDVRVLIDQLTKAREQGLDPATPTLLQNYERQRRTHNTQMMWAMDFFYHAFSNEVPPLKWLRNLALSLANQAHLPKRQVLRFALGLTAAPQWLVPPGRRN